MKYVVKNIINLFTFSCRVTCGVILLLAFSCNLEIIPDSTGMGPADAPPVACFTIDKNVCIVGDCNLQFNASCSERVTTYRWDFDNDGTFEVDGINQSSQSFNYTDAGSYTVRLEVEDDRNRVDTTTLRVVVNAVAINTYETTEPGLGPATGLVVLPDGSMTIIGAVEGNVYFRQVDPDGNILTNRRYITARSDAAFDLIRLADGSYVIVGSSLDLPTNTTDVFYLKTSSNGDPIDGPLSISLAGENTSVNSVVELPNGNIQMAGTARNRNNGNRDIFVAQYTPALIQVFKKKIALPDRETVRDVTTSQTGFIVVGEQTVGNGRPAAMFARFNTDGDLLSGFPVFFGGGNGRTYECINRVGSDEYFLAGLTAPDGDLDFLVNRTNMDGTPVTGLPKSFGSTLEEAVIDGIVTPDGGMILAGNQDGNALIVKVTPDGEEDWREDQQVNGNNAFNRIALMPDGGYAVCGYRGTSMYYAKTNQVGVVE